MKVHFVNLLETGVTESISTYQCSRTIRENSAKISSQNFLKIHMEINEKIKHGAIATNNEGVISKEKFIKRKLKIRNFLKKDNKDLEKQIESLKRLLFIALLNKATYILIKSLFKRVETLSSILGDNTQEIN